MNSSRQTDRNSLRRSGEVARTAKDHLKRTPYRAIRDVSCECDHGVLVLRGRLTSYYHKQLAQEAVSRLDGVTQVVNEIEVQRPDS
jgi:osmotically-inducible protein OsmY